MSRSIRRWSFSRRGRALSATRSDGNGAGACVRGRLAGPVACVPYCIIHRRKTVSCRPNSRATAPADRPLLATRSNRLSFEGLRKDPTLHAHQTLLSSFEKLAWVSTETREDQVGLVSPIWSGRPSRNVGKLGSGRHPAPSRLNQHVRRAAYALRPQALKEPASLQVTDDHDFPANP